MALIISNCNQALKLLPTVFATFNGQFPRTRVAIIHAGKIKESWKRAAYIDTFSEYFLNSFRIKNLTIFLLKEFKTLLFQYAAAGYYGKTKNVTVAWWQKQLIATFKTRLKRRTE